MRAVGLLTTFAFLDAAVVAVGGLAQADTDALAALRIPLLAILAITGIGVVALAVLGHAARWLERREANHWRTLGGFFIGAAYGGAILGCLGWAALWLSPRFGFVALAGLVCAGLLVWQSWAEAEMGRSEFPLRHPREGGDPS
jgi:hypothetical protein